MTDSFKLRAGWLIDGSGGPVRKEVIVKVDRGTIVSIRNSINEDTRLPNIQNLNHCTVLPGLIDSHAHLFMSGTADRAIRENQLDASFEEIKPVIAGHIAEHFKYGVLAIRDGGDRKAHTLRYKRAYLNGDKTSIHVNVSGKAWHYPNRYGRLIGRTPPENGTLADAIIKETDRVDQVKIVNSGLNSLICFGKQTKPQFTLNELSNAVNAANRRCLPVMVHANGRAPVEIAINAGVRSIEHGFFMGKENLKKMADRRVFWVPTAFTMKAYAANLNATHIRTDVPQRNLDYQLEQIAVAKALGVPIALGTDAGSLGVDHGRGVIEELNLLIEAGFSIQEAVRCATLNGATLLGLNDSGRLTRNATATFIAVKGAPSELPESLSRIERIYLNGRFFDANFSRPSYPD